MTTQEMLEAWDRGDIVWSMNMGGMGPGYDQAIQVLAVEIVRDNIDNPPTKENWDEWGDDSCSRIDKDHGFSGAQFGAAKWLASCFIREGYQEAMDRFRKKVKEEGDEARIQMFQKETP